MMALSPYDYARKKVVYCWLEETINDVAKRFAEEGIGSMIVDDQDGKHVGMITSDVIFKAISTCVDVCSLKVKNLKLEKLVTVKMDADIDSIMPKFNETDSGRIAIVGDEDEVVGILKKSNIERFARFEVGEKLAKQGK